MIKLHVIALFVLFAIQASAINVFIAGGGPAGLVAAHSILSDNSENRVTIEDFKYKVGRQQGLMLRAEVFLWPFDSEFLEVLKSELEPEGIFLTDPRFNMVGIDVLTEALKKSLKKKYGDRVTIQYVSEKTTFGDWDDREGYDIKILATGRPRADELSKFPKEWKFEMLPLNRIGCIALVPKSATPTEAVVDDKTKKVVKLAKHVSVAEVHFRQPKIHPESGFLAPKLIEEPFLSGHGELPDVHYYMMDEGEVGLESKAISLKDFRAKAAVDLKTYYPNLDHLSDERISCFSRTLYRADKLILIREHKTPWLMLGDAAGAGDFFFGSTLNAHIKTIPWCLISIPRVFLYKFFPVFRRI